MMNDVMLDLETMGSRPGSAIVAIGAVFFDPDTRSLGEKFYRTVSLADAAQCGLTMDPQTVMWWMQQGEAAKQVFSEIGESLPSSLRIFATWLRRSSKKHELRMWGCGSDFDNVLLSVAYDRCQIELPWEFYNNRCYRTLKNLRREIKIERVGTHHNALDDAVSQAQHAICILNPQIVELSPTPGQPKPEGCEANGSKLI